MSPPNAPALTPCYVLDAAGTLYRVYDRLPVVPRGHRPAIVAPGHPAAIARVFVREGDHQQFVMTFGSGSDVLPTDVRPGTLAAQVQRAVQGEERHAPTSVSEPPSASPPLRFVDGEGTAWRVYDARETPPPGGDPPPRTRPGRVTLDEMREFLEREVPRPPVRVFPPGSPRATHRLFVRAGDRWRFDYRLPAREVGDCTDATLRAQISRALGRDPSPRGLSAEAHRARCREHRAARAARDAAR